MSTKRILGIDLGAESGRVMLGTLTDGRLCVEEAHRFPNEPVRLHDTLTWDLPRLFREVVRGIARGVALAGGKVDSVGCDSWGVDFGILDRRGGILVHPVHYRDPRTDGMMAEVFGLISKERIFAETGLQFLSLNTLFQLAALKKRTPEVFGAAGKLLLMADLVHYLLGGRAAAETCLASTSQLWNPLTRSWSNAVIDALGVPRDIFPELVEPGTRLAPLRNDLKREVNAAEAPLVIAPGSHDTASAIAAVPAEAARGWAYLSSGTWSLFGVELASPRVSPEALEANFTNEAGIARSTRFLRNLTGLWLVQECRRRWARDGEDLDYGKLAQLAEPAGPARAIVVPGASDFFAPDDMPEAIRAFCRRTEQPVPGSKGEILRCALESLALSYRATAEEAQAVTGETITRLHVVGGGSQNALLNQLTADALGVPVIAGPVEATAMGNVLVQAMGLGAVRDLAELRSIVRASAATRTFEPREPSVREEKIALYRELSRKAGA